MKKTRHLVTASPPNAEKSAHMMKTTTAGIGIHDGSGGSGGLDDNTSATTTF